VDGIGGLGRGRLDERVSGILIGNVSFVGRCRGFGLMPMVLRVLVLYLSSRKTGFGTRVPPLGVGSSDLDGQRSL